MSMEMFSNKMFILILVLSSLLSSCHGQNNTLIDAQPDSGGNKVRRSIIDPYAGLPPFAPFGAGPPPFGFGFPPYPFPFPPPFPPPPFPPPFGGFPPPLAPPLPLPPPPVLPFPLPFYPPGPPFGFGYPYAPPLAAAPPPPPPPPPPPIPAPAPIILPAHTAATLSVASLLHALIAKKFYPPVVPFPVPRPVPFPVTVKVPVPVAVPVDRPEHNTILRPSNHYEEAEHVLHEDKYHEMENEWNSAPPEIIRLSE